jgi:3-phosphoshikimate 1-carboxyvinyltransferase
VADLRVRHSALTGHRVDPAIAPSMIDEFPVLFVAAALARAPPDQRARRTARQGKRPPRRHGRRADRWPARGWRSTRTAWSIHGTGGEPLPGTRRNAAVATHLDHRIAMSMAVAGLASERGVEVDDTARSPPAFPGNEQEQPSQERSPSEERGWLPDRPDLDRQPRNWPARRTRQMKGRR